MASRRRTLGFIGAALLAAAVAVPAIALASGGYSLNVKGPHTAHVLKRFDYTVKGKSVSGIGVVLATFLNPGVKCKQKYYAEFLSRPPTGSSVGLKKGSFSYKIPNEEFKKGTYYFCVYIYRQPFTTLAKAFRKVVVKH
jgi:hypothetical protein